MVRGLQLGIQTWSSLRRAICHPYDTHTLLDSRHRASRAWREITGNVGSYQVSSSLLDPHSPSNRPDRCRPSMRANSQPLPFCANDVGKLRETTRFTRRPEQTSRRAFTAQGDLARMEQAKLPNGSGHKPIGHSSTSAPKKAARKKAESARPLWKETGSKSKSEKLVCRYCGSEDLAASFIKRRDRRCRKCFSKRYGSAAGERKAKLKK